MCHSQYALLKWEPVVWGHWRRLGKLSVSAHSKPNDLLEAPAHKSSSRVCVCVCACSYMALAMRLSSVCVCVRVCYRKWIARFPFLSVSSVSDHFSAMCRKQTWNSHSAYIYYAYYLIRFTDFAIHSYFMLSVPEHCKPFLCNILTLSKVTKTRQSYSELKTGQSWKNRHTGPSSREMEQRHTMARAKVLAHEPLMKTVNSIK